ncbi:hypothetical protein KZ829_03090 [Actinoplanes hulinensis]|uniref:DUF4145 domain-containing protein n=1 Tax=Actinoplanes hulinensis TaxID=1144547 RepID=A0ABS7AVI0_9ACTN|nr:hypothetical protein [Actinoplanes hulinensis]MBW6432725.1 hypothetical protein [Actinoplanes hulinensis]
MLQSQQILTYARRLADDLGKDMELAEAYGGGVNYWTAVDHEAGSRIQARSIAALDFLKTYAVHDSAWTERATEAYQAQGQTDAQKARDLGDILRMWADQVEAGIAEIAGARARAEVGIVSTDVMGQVRALLEDRSVHPAAPIVLCGAALEIALRAVADGRNVSIPAQPTMNRLIGAVRGAGILSVQDVKDLEAAAGLRNQAAHGHFDALSHERAGLMEQQTNILLRRLAELMPE